jgi:hypothetical protein
VRPTTLWITASRIAAAAAARPAPPLPPMSAARGPALGSPGSNPAGIRLNTARPLWLEVPGGAPAPRFLLLEDPETGDVLLPLVAMKAVLESNYSRKLAALKNRVVVAPAGPAPAHEEGLLFWHWAFEAPHTVKVAVRRELGDATPQGHMRLVLLPIVYNAMAQQERLRASPLFRALHAAVCRSAYAPLVHQLDAEHLAEVEGGEAPAAGEGGEGAAAAGDAAGGALGGDADDDAYGASGAPVTAPPPAPPLPLDGDAPPPPLAAADAPPPFAGPRDLAATIAKYAFSFHDQGELEARKRLRTVGEPNFDDGAGSPPSAEPPGGHAADEYGYGGAGAAAARAAAAAAAAGLGLPPIPAMLPMPPMPGLPLPRPSRLQARVRELAAEVRLLKSNFINLYNVVTHLAAAAQGAPPLGGSDGGELLGYNGASLGHSGPPPGWGVGDAPPGVDAELWRGG